jgi:16S rRNA (adenine1518-N6/adenine1519-N6)-dimethyltransferase
VVAVELDRGLLPVLGETMAEYDNFEVVQGDVLEVDLAKLCREKFGDGRVVACANLPYYITTPAITALLTSRAFERITVMVQKEVAQRICAQPGTSDYSAFTIHVQYRARTEMMVDVSANCFVPRPKVDSAVVRLTPLAKPAVAVQDENLFFTFVRAAFNMRRKTLVNALAPVFGDKLDKEGITALIESVGLDKRVRGERLSLADFARLADKAKVIIGDSPTPAEGK